MADDIVVHQYSDRRAILWSAKSGSERIWASFSAPDERGRKRIVQRVLVTTINPDERPRR